jgi:hypothetical protein
MLTDIQPWSDARSLWRSPLSCSIGTVPDVLAWLEGDDGHAAQGQHAAGKIPCRWTDSLDCPEPQNRDRDIHASIGGIRPAGCCGRVQREQPRESGQTDSRRNEQPWATTFAQPAIRKVTANDFGNRCNVNKEMSSCFSRLDWPRHLASPAVCGSKRSAFQAFDENGDDVTCYVAQPRRQCRTCRGRRDRAYRPHTSRTLHFNNS